MNEVKEIVSFLIACIVVAAIIASCSVLESRHNADVMKACFERVDNVAECAWFERNR